MHTVPGVQKLLHVIRVGNVEERCEFIDKRVESLESKAYVFSDVVKDLVHEEFSELKEIESCKLDRICLNLPESNKRDRQLENQNNLLETMMDLDPDIIVVNKLVRLGRRDSSNGPIKCRPLRFTVDLFDHKSLNIEGK